MLNISLVAQLEALIFRGNKEKKFLKSVLGGSRMEEVLREKVGQTVSAEIVKEIVEHYGYSRERLLSILLDIQKASEFNYISEEAAEAAAKLLDMPITKLYDVISFYSMLNLEPKGKYIIEICKSPSCHVNSCREKAKIFEKLLGISMGQTTEDKLFTLEYTSCFGACDVGPAAKIGEKVYGNLDSEKIENIIKVYRGEK